MILPINYDRTIIRKTHTDILIHSLAIIVILIAVFLGYIDIFNGLNCYMLSFILIFYIFIRLYFRFSSFDVFSPAIGIPVLLFLYSTVSASYVEERGITEHGDYVSTYIMNLFYIACTTGLIGLTAGMLLAQNNCPTIDKLTFFKKLLLNNKKFKKKMFIATLFISMPLSFWLFPLFDFTNVASYGERALSLRVERLADISSGVKDVFLTMVPVTMILCCATMLIFNKKNIVLKFVGLIILFSYLAQNTLAGWRGVVVSAAVIPLIYYHYRIKRINMIKIALLGIFVLLFMNTLSFVRTTSDFSAMINLVVGAVQSGNTKFLALQSSTELFTGMNLHRLISGIENNETSYTYGLSIIHEFMVFIPKVFFSSRPLSLSEQFVQTFYPGLLEEGGGYGFFFIQEGYWAFGAIGVFLFMLIYGWSVQLIYQWVIKNIKYDIVVFIYAGIYNVLVISSVRSGIIGLYKIVLMGLIPFLVVVYLPWNIPFFHRIHRCDK